MGLKVMVTYGPSAACAFPGANAWKVNLPGLQAPPRKRMGMQSRLVRVRRSPHPEVAVRTWKMRRRRGIGP
jgi:hypothetical protein